MNHPVIEKFTTTRMEQINTMLQALAEQGRPKFYRVAVDELEVIPKTNDPALFETYSQYITPLTYTITIKLYQGNSNINSQHILRLREGEPDRLKPQGSQSEEELNGIDLDAKIEARLAAERQAWKLEQLVADNQRMEGELADQEAYIEQLEEAVLELKDNKKLTFGNINLGELSSVVIEGIVRRNPQLLANLPGGEALAGIIEADNTKQSAAQPNVAEADFTEIREEGQSAPSAALSETDVALLQFCRELQEAFTKEQLGTIQTLLNYLSKAPALLGPVLQFIMEKSTGMRAVPTTDASAAAAADQPTPGQHQYPTNQ